jgi:cyclopropane fatty-acyl-phospholipid synthase-like methyltransferase
VNEEKKKIFPEILKRLLYPKHLFKVIQLQRNRKKVERVYDDAQLKLYHKIMPGDFLHYGFFKDINIKAIDISLGQVYKAQLEYAYQIIDLIKDFSNPVLDIGCGMGGLLRIMNERNLQAIGITPDINQIQYIRNTYPNQVIAARFEDMDTKGFVEHFGTVLTSESLQYLKLDDALPLIQKILKTGGQWISCDYFKLGEAGEKSGHNYKIFLEKLAAHGFKITMEKDITPNVLPMIDFVHLWATQVVLPLKEFGVGKLKVKAPGFYYAVENSLPEIDAKIQKNIDTINPELFKQHKQYLLMVIERV